MALIKVPERIGVTKLLIRWVLNAVALLVVARIVPGFHVHSLTAALLAALVIGFVNATLGVLLKIITLPLTIVTFGLFLLVVNALMLEFSASIVPGFAVRGFAAAFWGALALSVIHLIARRITKD
jgi:putative membrane protein